MQPDHDPVALYRHVLQSGDTALADIVGRALRRDPRLRRRAELALASMPRAPGVHDPAAERVLAALVERLGLAGP